jgi:16S rRNA processing protein RimM
MAEGEERPHFVAVGSITGAHGIRGEVKVQLLTDYPERFRPGAKMLVGTEGTARPIEIATVRQHHQSLLVRLVTVDSRDAAETLVGLFLMIPEDQLMPLGEHENYAHDLLGLRVETSDGRYLGQLTDLLATGANDVYVVSRPEGQGEVLIPALRDVVQAVDLSAGLMVVSLPDGLLE